MNTTQSHASLLVVDDTLKNIQVLGTVLRDAGYQIHVARDGLQALEVVETAKPDLILLDIMMPTLDGFETCRRLKANEQTREIPVIFLTAKTETEDVATGFELGAVDYVTKPFNATELLARVNTHIELYKLQRELETRVQQRTTTLRESLNELTQSQRETYDAHLDTIRRLAVAAEYKDEETATVDGTPPSTSDAANHIERVSLYSTMLAQGIGLPEDDVELIRVATPLHDIGKIGIPDAILFKAGPLDRAERAIIEQHTVIGAELLRGSPSKLLQAGEVIALSHHEKWDGTGYPNRLAEENIPLWGRICAVADVFDSLVNRRPQRKALSNENALNILKEAKGRHFDPALVEGFVGCFELVVSIQQSTP